MPFGEKDVPCGHWGWGEISQSTLISSSCCSSEDGKISAWFLEAGPEVLPHRPEVPPPRPEVPPLYLKYRLLELKYRLLDLKYRLLDLKSRLLHVFNCSSAPARLIRLVTCRPVSTCKDDWDSTQRAKAESWSKEGLDHK